MADTKTNVSAENVSRRGLLKGLGAMGVAAAAGAGAVAAYELAGKPSEAQAMPPSKGYLLIDSKKCAGGMSCMMACSLAHEGFVDLSLSRIQVKKNARGNYPNAISQFTCRQCPYPSCADACPVNAVYADPQTGVRMINEDACIGCQRCMNACPFTPSRIQWNYLDQHAQKCDLCANTPHWDQEGGAGNSQACVQACHMKAIKFTDEMPVQTDYGYDVNLRNIHFARVGFPIDDAGMQPAVNVL